ncbi:MAG TPA: hypothetical protein VIY51_28540 [Xanthobacteraceae bacterium]
MKQRLIWIFRFVLPLCLLPSPLFAAGRAMECGEWVDEEYRGTYLFSLGPDAKSTLSISYKPEGQNLLFGKSVRKWTLLWQKERNAVFYGEDSDDWTGPVKLLSLNFSDVTMFTYSLGGATEGDELASRIVRRCRRLD